MNVEALETVVVETGENPSFTVVWLHGLGADGHDFEPIVPELPLPSETSVRFVFPHAPFRPVTINNGMVMRAWYDILGMDFGRSEDESGIRASAELVEALLAQEKARGIPSRRILLAGFSQGGALASHVALRHEEPLAGLAILSAYVLLEEATARETSDANRGIPIFQAHGTGDPVVPIAMGERSRDWLTTHGHTVEWRTYPVPHAVHPQEIADLGAWMASRLADSSE
jgi:phospholipase/carboxylesterase